MALACSSVPASRSSQGTTYRTIGTLQSIGVPARGHIGKSAKVRPSMDDIFPLASEPVNGSLHERLDFGLVANVSRSIIDTRPLSHPEGFAECCVKVLYLLAGTKGCRWKIYLGILDEVVWIGTIVVERNKVVLAVSGTGSDPVLPISPILIE